MMRLGNPNLWRADCGPATLCSVTTAGVVSLAWNERSVDLALAQAHRYADEQRVGSIAVSDGIMLYACDHIGGPGSP